MNYEGIPYVTTLLSTALWTYYGLLKSGGLLIVTVNGTGSVMQATYVIFFLIFAPMKTRVSPLCSSPNILVGKSMLDGLNN